MMIFDKLKNYPARWTEKSRRSFSREERDEIKEAIVVESQYGLSARFTRLGGGVVFIPMAIDCPLGAGEIINLSEAVLITLSKDGENDIWRVAIK